MESLSFLLEAVVEVPELVDVLIFGTLFISYTSISFTATIIDLTNAINAAKSINHI